MINENTAIDGINYIENCEDIIDCLDNLPPEIEAEVKEIVANTEYMSEPTLNSELILRNNRLKLQENPSLFNDEHLEEVLSLRVEYERLNQDTSSGLQKIKRDIRNKIRELSTKTYVMRDDNIFGGMVLQLINNIATRPNFSGYSYLDDMKSLASEHITKYTHKFASYKQSKISGQYISAFTYISTIIFNAYVATIKKQNKEGEKIKKDFLENQKLFHRDPNTSTYGQDHTEIEKTVHITNIPKKLINEIEKITLDCMDILVMYPPEYEVNLKEYIMITQYGEKHKLNLSLVRDIPLGTSC